MSAAGAELSSLATALEELTRRVTAIAEHYAEAKRDDLAGDLYAAERALAGAHRRLARVSATDTQSAEEGRPARPRTR